MMPPQPPTVNPNSLDFGNPPQGDSKTLQVMISNPGTQPMLWDADTSKTRWLALDTLTGNLQPGQSLTVNVTVNTHFIVVGKHTATLTFTSEGDNKSASTQVPVILTVSPASGLEPQLQQNFAVSSLEARLSFTRNLNSSQTLPLVITNWDSQNALKWSADNAGTNWLSLDRIEGILQPGERQTIYVTADTNPLKLGNYAATLNFITTTMGTESTEQIQAELHVGERPDSDSGPKSPVTNPTRLDFDTVWHQAALKITSPGPQSSPSFNTQAVNLKMDNRGMPG